MKLAAITLRGVRLAVILVEPHQLDDPLPVLRQAAHLNLPIMLVARDDTAWNGVRARAEFDPAPYLAELLVSKEIAWRELMPPAPEPLPF